MEISSGGAVVDNKTIETNSAGEIQSIGGSGYIFLSIMDYNAIIQGTWTVGLSVNFPYAIRLTNSTSADGDEINYKVSLEKGTYDIYVRAEKNTNAGIGDITIDGVSVGTMDFYGSPQTQNIQKVINDVVVESSGIKTISLKLNGKNASSSDYFLQFHSFVLVRTA